MSDLEVFCNVCLSKIEINKKFKKTDIATLLKLLDPTIPDKTIASYKKNNAGWNEGNLLYHFNKIIFPLFLSALKIQSDKVELDPDGGVITEKFDFRYLDFLLSGTSKQIKELQEEVEDLQTGKGYISFDDHCRETSMLREKIKLATQPTETLERKLLEQRKFFEDKISYAEKEAEKRINYYQKLYEDILEKDNN
jgi:hypothetical protein